MPVMCVDERQEDRRRQLKPTAASTNCVPQATRSQKILWLSGHPRTKYPQRGKLRPMGIVGPVDNSVSRDSDRFLAVGAVTQSDRLEIELVQRPDTPATILIKWPPQPTVTDPAKLTATIAAIVRWPRAAPPESSREEGKRTRWYCVGRDESRSGILTPTVRPCVISSRAQIPPASSAPARQSPSADLGRLRRG